MRPVTRESIIDQQTYSKKRNLIRKHIMSIKEPRRIHVGEYLTFLFENTETILYQIQEMIRVEQIVKEKDIQHEIDTYNEILGSHGELGGTLLIEITNERNRKEYLKSWKNLMDHIYMKLDDGSIIKPIYDPRQLDGDRISCVQYFKFDVGDRTPCGLGCHHPKLMVYADLSPAQKKALRNDSITL